MNLLFHPDHQTLLDSHRVGRKRLVHLGKVVRLDRVVRLDLVLPRPVLQRNYSVFKEKDTMLNGLLTLDWTRMIRGRRESREYAKMGM